MLLFCPGWDHAAGRRERRVLCHSHLTHTARRIRSDGGLSAAASMNVNSPGSRKLTTAFRRASEYVAGSQPGSEMRWRIIRLLNFYRVVAGMALLALYFSIDPPIVGGANAELFYLTAIGLFVHSIIAAVFISRRHPVAATQLSASLFVDIVLVALLLYSSGGVQSGLGSLLVVSIGAGSLLLNRRDALTYAAIGTIAVLAQQILGQWNDTADASGYAPTGVLGVVFFLIAVAGSEAGRRIRESEALAERRGVDLENLSQLNAYILQRLRESIVVVDADKRVRLINESAARHLGVPTESNGQPLAGLSPQLYDIWRLWNVRRDSSSATQPSLISSDGSSMIIPHFAPLGETTAAGTLIFLEDASHISERVQQTKLASLGRLSASIAHEIRNPIGAMSHAAQLLAESEDTGAEEQRLIQIIDKQAQRVSEIVENVLQLSRRDATRPQRMQLLKWLDTFINEFALTEQIDSHDVHVETEDGDVEVRTDPSHLHQVLWNLCANATKYASGANGHTHIDLILGHMKTNGRPYLEVADRGPGIPAEEAQQIFEPFYTGSGKGTGLGLYIARELCECNSATLVYEAREGSGSIFRIVFSDPNRWTSNGEPADHGRDL